MNRRDQWRYHNDIIVYTYESSLCSDLTVLRLFRLIKKDLVKQADTIKQMSFQNKNIKLYGDLLLLFEVLISGKE